MDNTQEKYEFDQFKDHCHLWNVVLGGDKTIVLLRKIIDSLQSDSYSNPYQKRPSFLIVGDEDTGKNLVARAIANSMAIEDIREAPGRYLDNGIASHLFFRDSLYDTTHIITNIECLNKTGECNLWKYLKDGFCKYFNFRTHAYDLEQHCYGMIIMTVTERDRLSKSPILQTVDHVIELEPYSSEQVKIIAHQLLKFCSTEYAGEQILEEILDQGSGQVGLAIDFMKTCVLIMRAEMLDCLDMEIVEKAKRIWQTTVHAPSVKDMPFKG